MARRLTYSRSMLAAACALLLGALGSPGAGAAARATAADDRLSGTARADVLAGRGGDDVLAGRGGADRLSGGRGNDVLRGGGGRDRLSGGPGDDRLSGDAGADVLDGGPGRDRIGARDGARDRIACGPGRDTAILDAIDRARGCEIVRRPVVAPVTQQAPAGQAPSAPVPGPTGPPGGVDPPPPPDPDPDPPPPDTTPQLLAAGDIADCTPASEATAKLLDELPGTVTPLGDTVQNYGTAEEFANCYEPTWGRHKWRTRPAVGNHEYDVDGALPYYAYFGDRAGDPSKGYYSYDLGAWHVVVLNSNCAEVGGCNEGSPQITWLRADLAAGRSACTAAYWHSPRFSSGKRHGSDLNMRTFWQVLYENSADLVLNGHDHNYERFAPQTPDGDPDPTDGIRQFVVGTGGRFLRPVQTTPEPNSEAIDNATFGVLRVELLEWGYSWKFMPAAPGTFTDSGTAACH